MNTRILPLIGLIVAITLWVGNGSVSAQQSENYARLDSTQAYWKLKADYSDQKPVVQFFGSHHKLLYQEQLPGLSNRVTKRTLRAFDRLLVSLTNNRILATTYLASNDDLSPVNFTPSPTEEKNLKQVAYKKGMAMFSVDPAVSQTGRLTIHFAQRTNRLVHLSLEDEEGKVSYFEDNTKLPVYQRVLRLDKLPGGAYAVRVRAGQFAYVYRLTIDRSLNRYHLQAK